MSAFILHSLSLWSSSVSSEPVDKKDVYSSNGSEAQEQVIGGLIPFTPNVSTYKGVRRAPQESSIVRETDYVKELLWHSLDGTSPTSFNQIVVTQDPFGLQLVDRIEVPAIGRIYILVNESLYGEIRSHLDQYLSDVVDAGYSVEVYTVLGGTPEDIRSFLQDGLPYDLIGCVFVGDVPEPWYEIYNCWGTGYNEEFPMDLFYMDLDGMWTDSDDDGIYDGHSGDVAPEIWVGRLKASNIYGDEASLIKNYFEKNHRYRTGELTTPRRALIYIDDDWVSMADGVNSSLSEIYNGMTDVVVDGATTTAEDYKSRIAEGYEWVHLQCHGSTGGHTFKIGSNWTGGTVYSTDYTLIDPPVFFYQLFVCSGARYVEPNYLAGSCIFTDDYGLLALGSTKTGSMLWFSDFYGNLAEGDCVGEAFRRWFMEYGEYEPCWFYGLAIIGDPTLIPASQVVIDQALISDGRCDVASFQWVAFHATWTHSNKDVVGNLYINGTKYVTNGTGWISLTCAFSFVGKKTWVVTGVNCSGVTVFSQTAPNPSIVWDRLEVYDYGVTDDRCDVGTIQKVWVRIRYDYDDVILDDDKGNISIGGTTAMWDAYNTCWYITVVQDVVAKINYLSPSSFTDDAYSLTDIADFITQSIIWDRIKIIDGGVSRTQTNITQTESVWFKAVYEFDGIIFNQTTGKLYVNGSAITWSSANEMWEYKYAFNTPRTRAFKVSGISDTQFGLVIINDLVGGLSITWKEFESIYEGVTYKIPIDTNSTISDFIFDHIAKQIHFTVGGPEGTIGTTNITIPKELVPEGYELQVCLDGESHSFTLTENVTCHFIYITYIHSLHQITINITDTTSPLLSITSPRVGFTVKSSRVLVSWSGSDVASGIDHYEVKLDEDPWVNVGNDTSYTFNGLGDGNHIVYVKAMDEVGNSNEDQVSFTVNTSFLGGPGWIDDLAIFGALIGIVAISIFFIIKKMRTQVQTPDYSM